MHRVFILSPANSSGERAQLISNPRASFSLARRLQRGEKAPLGEIFSFLSGLYFRGKLAYAKAFGHPPAETHGAYVITSNRGLIPVDEPVSLKVLESFANVPIDPAELKYRRPLEKDLKVLAKNIDDNCQVVLLGSISTQKYAEILVAHLGERLAFPSSFVGRGDMSRGGLLLRCVSENQELEYVPIIGATRRGKRPEKLAPRRWGYKIEEGVTVIAPATK
jgi:hypothetical protein